MATTQYVFAGSTVSGTAVGGMRPQEAREAVARAASEQLAQPVTLTVEGGSDTLVPAESGVGVDAAASVGRLTGFTLNPLTLVERLGGARVEAVTAVDHEALTAALHSRLGTLSSGTQDATVTLQGTTPVLTPAASGTGVDVEASVQALAARWPLGEQTVPLIAGTTRPAVTDEEARALVDEVLTPLLSANVTVTAVGTPVEQVALGEAVFSPQQLAAATTISAEGGELTAALDPQALHQQVLSAMGAAIETPAVNPSYSIDGSGAGAAAATPDESVQSDPLVHASFDIRVR